MNALATLVGYRKQLQDGIDAQVWITKKKSLEYLLAKIEANLL